MTDLYLDKTYHDITLDGRDLRLSVEGEDVAQRLTIALQFLSEEWFLDTTRGVPFTQTIIEAGSGDVETLSAIYRSHINRVEGVVKINALELSFGGDNRILTIALTVNDSVDVEVAI